MIRRVVRAFVTEPMRTAATFATFALFFLTSGLSPHAIPLRFVPAAPESAGRMPPFGRPAMAFEPNQGQAPDAVQFLARGAGYLVRLEPAHVTLSLRRDVEANGPDSGPGRAFVRIHTEGANSESPSIPGRKLPGVTNYYRGNRPEAWVTGVAHYATVTYPSITPGVDLVYHGRDGHLEYDFVVAPGADPESIVQRIEGHDIVTLNSHGDLVLAIDGRDVVFEAPVTYQELDGDRVIVESRYRLLGNHRFGFEVGDYDATRPLVIDPVVVYSTFLGGTQGDFISAIEVAADGGPIVAGGTESSLFAGVSLTPSSHNREAFIAKFSPDGSSLDWVTILGGTGTQQLGALGDHAHDLALDLDGGVYIAGETSSMDFPATAGAFDTTYNGQRRDAFAAKLDSMGMLVYATYLGSGSTTNPDSLTCSVDIGTDVAVDAGGHAYVGVLFSWAPEGNFLCDIQYPTTPGAYDEGPQVVGQFQSAVTKLSPDGSSLVYSTLLRDKIITGAAVNNSSNMADLAVDGQGFAYVLGHVNNDGFPTTDGAFQTTHSGGEFDIHLTKLGQAGSDIVYSTLLGGTGADTASAVAVDAMGRAYVLGATSSTDFPTTPGAYQTAYGGGARDAFVLRFNATGTALDFSTYVGGAGAESTGNRIDIDAAGHILVIGSTTSASGLPISADALQSTVAGGSDVFIARLDPTASSVSFSTLFGGAVNDTGADFVLTTSGGIIFAGTTQSADYPTWLPFDAFGPATGTSAPAFEGFVTKLDIGLDTDGDGVQDGADNCVAVPNPDQLDTDTDGIGDQCDADLDDDGVDNAADNCATTPNPDQADTDGDFTGDACDANPNDGPLADIDGDGVLNGVDACAAIAEDLDGVQDDDGCPETDADGDGVPDESDAFPLDPAESVDTDGDGTGNNADQDDDADGVADGTDCQPLNPAVYPGAPEVPGNNIDDNCNGQVDELSDVTIPGLLEPYEPPPTSFRRGRTIPLRWQYAVGGVAIDSATAAPVVTLWGPVSCGDTSGGATIDVGAAGNSGYQYDPLTRTWAFNWRTTGVAAGCYYIQITSPTLPTHVFAISVR